MQQNKNNAFFILKNSFIKIYFKNMNNKLFLLHFICSTGWKLGLGRIYGLFSMSDRIPYNENIRLDIIQYNLLYNNSYVMNLIKKYYINVNSKNNLKCNEIDYFFQFLRVYWRRGSWSMCLQSVYCESCCGSSCCCGSCCGGSCGCCSCCCC